MNHLRLEASIPPVGEAVQWSQQLWEQYDYPCPSGCHMYLPCDLQSHLTELEGEVAQSLWVLS